MVKRAANGERTPVATTRQSGEWLSTNEASEALGITPRTLYRFINAGDLPAYKIGRVDPAPPRRDRRVHRGTPGEARRPRPPHAARRTRRRRGRRRTRRSSRRRVATPNAAHRALPSRARRPTATNDQPSSRFTTNIDPVFGAWRTSATIVGSRYSATPAAASTTSATVVRTPLMSRSPTAQKMTTIVAAATSRPPTPYRRHDCRVSSHRSRRYAQCGCLVGAACVARPSSSPSGYGTCGRHERDGAA